MLLGGALSAVSAVQRISPAAKTPTIGARRRRPSRWLGLSPFWATVVRGRADQPRRSRSTRSWWRWRCRRSSGSIITGGILGIVAMRLVVGQLLALVQRYPALVDGAFVIIAWVGIKLCSSICTPPATSHFEIPKWLSLGLIVVIFVVSPSSTREGRDRSKVDRAGRGRAERHASSRASRRGSSRRDGRQRASLSPRGRRQLVSRRSPPRM